MKYDLGMRKLTKKAKHCGRWPRMQCLYLQGLYMIWTTAVTTAGSEVIDGQIPTLSLWGGTWGNALIPQPI